MANRYLVDIPDPSDLEGSWYEIRDFDTRKEAIAFVKETFGGDRQGRICLVSEVSNELDEEDSE